MEESKKDNFEDRDFLEVSVFKNKDVGFSYQIRWSAQKQAIKDCFDTYMDEKAGVKELRGCLEHSLRIKSQQEVKGLVARLLGKKASDFKGGNYVESVRVLTDEQIQEIKDVMIDWRYEANQNSVTPAEKLDKSLAKLSPEAALELLQRKMAELQDEIQS